MTAHEPTGRPFNVVVCTGCASDVVLPVLSTLRSTIRRCPHGMLVRASCLLGSLTCASRPTGAGVVVVLQPCTLDRVPSGQALWLGPVNDFDDVAALRGFIERGAWETEPLPERLGVHQRWTGVMRRAN